MNFLSISIITYNEEKNIGRCIDSVKKVADEILVLDSFSTDNTVHIARSKGAKVIQGNFNGYIEQKNAALLSTTHQYVLCLDADEALNEELTNSILRAKNNFSSRAYSMNRLNNYCGRFIRHGIWYPDRKLRLVNKSFAKWGGTNPHDKIELIEPLKIQHLPGDILHYSYNSIEEHVEQNNKLSTISAEALYSLGKQTNILKIFLNPFWAFFNGYFLRLGFLDGFYGFIVAINIAHLSFLKHSKLYRLQRNKDPRA